MRRVSKGMLIELVLLAAMGSLSFAAGQFPGQEAGQASAMAKTLADAAPRTFSGSSLMKLNYPLAGMGTGIIYFDGACKPVAWDIGKLGDDYLMANNSLFAVSVLNGTTRTTKKLQSAIARSLANQPTSSTRMNFNKQGDSFVGTCEVPPKYTGFNDVLTGVIETEAFIMPGACTKITALVGGGNDIGGEYLGLIDVGTGNLIARLTGDNAEAMTTKSMDIGPAYAGKSVRFRIADTRTAGWGHINVDSIQLKDSSDNLVTSTFTNGDFETGSLAGWTYQPKPDFALASIMATVEYPIMKYKFTDAVVDAEIEMFSPMIPLSERDSIVPSGIFHVKVTNKAPNPISVSVLSTLANGLYGTSQTLTAANNGNGTYVTMAATGFQEGTMQEGGLALWTNAQNPTYCAGAPSADALMEQVNSSGSLSNSPSGDQNNPVAGLCAPISLEVGETKTVVFTWSWYFPHMRGNDIWGGNSTDVSRRYVNYYNSVTDVMLDVKNRWSTVVDKTRLYHDTMYNTTLPYYFVDAVTANSDIMRSPTMFVTKVGEVYGWEGSDASGGRGCCSGNCMHVWNYAETVANLYPELARRWKTTDFTRQQTANGLLNNRIGSVPAPSAPSGEGVAIDGTLGAIAAAYREHQNSPDNSFLNNLWPNISKAMDGAIAVWDPNNDGVNENGANTTFDGPITGENSFVGAQYLAALRASEEMARVMGDATRQIRYHDLFTSGSAKLDSDTFNGEYYYQVGASQYGKGVMIDHLLGQSHAFQYGLGYLLPRHRVYSSMDSVFKYNFFSPMDGHLHPVWGDPLRVMANPDDDGVLICTFPNGGSGSALYLSEDWPGFDYEAAADLLYLGNANKALAIIHAVRSRQDGIGFDPLNERECGGYYARSLSSYGILVAASGIEKNGPQKMLGFNPHITPEGFRSFFTDVGGWGTFEQTRSTSASLTTQIEKITVKYGSLNLRSLQFYFPETFKGVSTVTATVKIDGVPVPATQKRTGNQVGLQFASDLIIRTNQAIEVTLVIESATS